MNQNEELHRQSFDNEANCVIKDEKDEEDNDDDIYVPTREEMLEALDHLIDTINGLPPYAHQSAVTQAEFVSVLALLSSVLRAS